MLSGIQFKEMLGLLKYLGRQEFDQIFGHMNQDWRDDKFDDLKSNPINFVCDLDGENIQKLTEFLLDKVMPDGMDSPVGILMF